MHISYDCPKKRSEFSDTDIKANAENELWNQISDRHSRANRPSQDYLIISVTRKEFSSCIVRALSLSQKVKSTFFMRKTF
jgi:hypothetical protein